MSWRINQVGVYSHSGDSRLVQFRLNGLNIITGDSQTGKSALQEIVAYCLATSKCPVPRGRVRNSCSAVGINITNGERSLNIIRLLPEGHHESTGKCHIDEGQVLPQRLPGKATSNLEHLVTELNAITGIQHVRVLQKFGDPTAEPDPLNIKHCRPYLFQPQDVIASRQISFPGIDDYLVSQHIKDSIPYFFGLLTATEFRQLAERRALDQERKRLEQQVREAERLGAQPLVRGRQLLERARELGLEVAPESGIANEAALVAELRRISLQARRKAVLPEPSNLDRDLKEVQRRIRQLQPRVLAYDEFVADASKHHAVIEEQRHRLDLAELLPKGEPGSCPLCNNPTQASSKVLGEVQAAGQLLDSIERNARPFEERINQRGFKLKEELKIHEKEAGRLARELATAQRLRAGDPQLHEKIQQLVGAIDQYLATAHPGKEGPQAQLAEVRKKLIEYDAIEAKRRYRRDQTEQAIGRTMQELAPRLRVEYPKAPSRFNLEHLTIEVNLGRWTQLSELGSGANWVNYHVLAATAIHLHFASQHLAVPHVLMIDQPSQAWYPPDPTSESQLPKGNRERQDVISLYKLLYDVGNFEHAPQIIAIDHARIAEPWFVNSIVEEWRKAPYAKTSPHTSLVPDEWPEIPQAYDGSDQPSPT